VSFIRFGSILRPLFPRRLHNLASTSFFCTSDPAPIPGHDHCKEADSQADFEPMRGEQQAGAGQE
jgi:hypothetical protein